jgi:hypothetical protein
MKFEYVEFVSGSIKKGAGGPPKSLNTNIVITNAREAGNLLELEFKYGVEYVPNGGSIILGGRASFAGEGAAECRKEWEKNGNISGKDGEYIINAIYHHAALNSLLIARAFNLAPPLALPGLKMGKATKNMGASPAKKGKPKR